MKTLIKFLFIFLLTGCYTIKSYTPIRITEKDGYYYQARILNTKKARYVNMLYNTDTICVGDTFRFVKIYPQPGVIDFILLKEY
jgi:hypothetical protein